MPKATIVLEKSYPDTLPLTNLHSFANHPFKLYTGQKMDDMVDSIIRHGVLMPILVRPRIEGGYEIIAGHENLLVIYLCI